MNRKKTGYRALGGFLIALPFVGMLIFQGVYGVGVWWVPLVVFFAAVAAVAVMCGSIIYGVKLIIRGGK